MVLSLRGKLAPQLAVAYLSGLQLVEEVDTIGRRPLQLLLQRAHLLVDITAVAERLHDGHRDQNALEGPLVRDAVVNLALELCQAFELDALVPQLLQLLGDCL